MSVVQMDDYRAPEHSGPVEISFIGPSMAIPEGGTGGITLTMIVENGDFESMIEAVKDAGGIYLPNPDPNGDFWFLPWPCAAVRIRSI